MLGLEEGVQSEPVCRTGALERTGSGDRKSATEKSPWETLHGREGASGAGKGPRASSRGPWGFRGSTPVLSTGQMTTRMPKRLIT